MSTFGSTRRLIEWVEALDGIKLPRMPRHTLDVDLDARRLAEQIYADPALVLSMIRHINSRSRRHMDSRLHSMEEAVILCGANGVQQVADSLPSAQSALTKKRYRGYLLTCERAVHAACQARLWAGRLADMLPNEVFTGTLLRHTAELAMWAHPEGVMELIREIAPDPTYTTDAEYVTLGFTLGELNSALAKEWRLPYLVSEASQGLAANSRSPRSWTVGLATRLAALAPEGWNHAEMINVREALGELLEIESDDVYEMIASGAREAAEMLPWQPVTFNSLLQKPDPETAPDEAAPPVTSRGGVCLATRWPIVRRIRKELESRDYQRSAERLTLKAEHRHSETDHVANLIVTGLYDGLGLSRVLYAQIHGDHETLSAYMLRGVEGNPVFHRFRVDITPDTLIRDICQQPAAVWVRRSHYQKLQPRLPAALQSLAEGRPFYLASLFAGDRIHGLVYADRHRADNDLDQSSFNAFRKFCALGAVRLANP